MSVSEMFKCLDDLRDKRCGSGATSGEILAAEQALAVRLPNSYRIFLSAFGWAEIYQDTLFGLGRSVPIPFELVKTTLAERYEMEPHIPPHLVPIMNDGSGNNYCLDTSHFNSDECPVVFWDHEHEDGSAQKPQTVAPSFDRWLIDRIVHSPHAGAQ